MPRKSIAEPVFDEQRKRWRVTIPESISEKNKRVRSWHKTREAARKYIAGITGGGHETEPAAVISPKLAMKADEARAILEPFGMDLVEAARELTKALVILDGRGTLEQAAKDYRAKHDASTSSMQLGKAVVRYLVSRENLRESTLKSYRYSLEKVIKPIHEKRMAEISTADLEKFLAPKGPTARAMHLRNLETFWRWASAPPRNWANIETLQSIEKPRVSNDTDIRILSPDDVKALLQAAEIEGAAAAYAIAIFGGVRMAELERLKWGDIHDEYIEIGKSVAKKHSRRLVPICPTLAAWIGVTRGVTKNDDPVVPSNWTDLSKSVRRRAGWDVAARLLNTQVKAGKLEKVPEPTRGKWPANACRHTCASVQVAIGTPLDDLVFKFGHSGGHELLRRHYVARMTRKDAIAILSIGPGGKPVPGIRAA